MEVDEVDEQIDKMPLDYVCFRNVNRGMESMLFSLHGSTSISCSSNFVSVINSLHFN